MALIPFDSHGLHPYDCAPMPNAPLPSQIDVRKLAVKGAEITAQPPIASLKRFADLLAHDKGALAVNLQFEINEQRIKCIDGHIHGDVQVLCQRCLEPMTLAMDVKFQLGIVWSEEDAERLPESLEPLIVGEDILVDLGDVVCEELILSLPFVSYHKPEDCQQEVGFISLDPAAPLEEVEQKRENPFKALEKIKFEK